MIGIYKITSPKGRIYIGKSINLEKRFKDYKYPCNTKGQPRIRRSLNLYGYENHKFEIIEKCEKENLWERENYYISLYKSNIDGLNCSGGRNTLGTLNSHSELSKQKISLAKKGIPSPNKGRKGIGLGRKYVKNNMEILTLNTETGIYYDTITDAAYAYNIKGVTLRVYFNRLNKYKHRHYKPFIFLRNNFVTS